MRFNGEWQISVDGITRPIIRAEILTGSGDWWGLDMLVDSGADRTVINKQTLDRLSLESFPSKHQLGGVGGRVSSIEIRTQLQLFQEDGQGTVFNGSYAAFLEDEALDMSVLGRDVLDLLVLILDRPKDVVALLGGNHTYTITP